MEKPTSGTQCQKASSHIQRMQENQNQEQKVRNISSMVKEWKNSVDNEIQCRVSWMQITRYGKFVMEYLSRQKIEDKGLFFDALACLDSLLSIFKLKLFKELNFKKSFYRNIQREFEDLCLEYNFGSGQKPQKAQEFQLYSILFLLVMLIYFSGRPELSKFKGLPLQIVNKSFINSLISLELNITEKNERIMGLILAYLVKNINLKIYGEKMLKFILNHFDKIHMARTVYHFVYCLREIHLEREIDLKILRRHGLIQKLWKFWTQNFDQRESIYLVDYINFLLRKYPLLLNNIGPMDSLISRIHNFQAINEFSIVHQGLILEIVSKFYPNLNQNMRQILIEKTFSACRNTLFSLKLLACIVAQESLSNLFEHIFPYFESFTQFSQHRELKSVLLGLEIFSSLVQKCMENKSWGMLQALKQKLGETLEELKVYHICRGDIARIEHYFERMISIKYLTLC